MAKSTLRLKKTVNFSIFCPPLTCDEPSFHRLNWDEIIIDNLSLSRCRREIVVGRRLGGRAENEIRDETIPVFWGATLSGGCRDKHLPIISHQHFQEPLLSKNKAENTIQSCFPLISQLKSHQKLVSWEKMRIVMKQLFVEQSVVFVLFTSGHHQRRDKQQFAIYSPSIRWCQKTTLCHQRFGHNHHTSWWEGGYLILRNANN